MTNIQMVLLVVFLVCFVVYLGELLNKKLTQKESPLELSDFEVNVYGDLRPRDWDLDDEEVDQNHLL